MLAIDTMGMHPTTESCIEALQRLHERREFKRILDMGCGGGILAIASAGIWDAEALAVDISPNAVSAARDNIAAHGLEENITVLRNDGFRHPVIAARAPYDLILCNLIAELLVKMLPDIKALLAPDGVCILSGALAWLAPVVEDTCEQLGLEITERLPNVEWRTYMIRKKTGLNPLSQKLNL